MKKYILTSSLFLFCILAKSQTSSPDVISSSGGYAIGAGFSNSYTIGQGSLPETFTTGTFILTQGFQQPQDVSTGFAPTADPFSFETYPNPTNGQFYLNYDLANSSEIIVEVFDVLGQSVFSEVSTHPTGHQTQLVSISNEPNGIYFVRCTIKSDAGITTHTSKITLTK